MKSTQQRRIGAFIIDAIIIGLLVTFVESLFSFLNEARTSSLFGIQFTYRFGVSILFYLCYFLLFDAVNMGNSIGKLLFKIRVISEDESEIGLETRMKRTLLKMVSIVILPISVLLFLFKDYYTIHEHYSDTLTIGNGSRL